MLTNNMISSDSQMIVSFVTGITVICAGISMWWVVRKYRIFKIDTKDDRNPLPNKKSEQKPANENKIITVPSFKEYNQIKQEFIGFPTETSSETNEKQLYPYLEAFAQFWEDVRKSAKQISNKETRHDLFNLCDKVRDDILPKLGVRLEDKEEGQFLIKTELPAVLLKERDVKRAEEEKKRQEKERKKSSKKSPKGHTVSKLRSCSCDSLASKGRRKRKTSSRLQRVGDAKIKRLKRLTAIRDFLRQAIILKEFDSDRSGSSDNESSRNSSCGSSSLSSESYSQSSTNTESITKKSASNFESLIENCACLSLDKYISESSSGNMAAIVIVIPKVMLERNRTQQRKKAKSTYLFQNLIVVIVKVIPEIAYTRNRKRLRRKKYSLIRLIQSLRAAIVIAIPKVM
jgi:hypothetical protein